MVEISYKQQCTRHREPDIKGRYFYVRSHDRSPAFFEGMFKLPEGHLFTAYSAIYNYTYLQSIDFFILQAGGDEQVIYRLNGQVSFDLSEFNPSLSPFVIGKFKVVCQGSGKTYGKRLIEWWLNGDYSLEYAELCAKYLKPRIKEIPAFELEKLKVPQPQPTDAVLGGDDFSRWLSTAAVLGGKRASKQKSM